MFEVLSPGNTEKEMQGKFVFYEKYGVEEYYVIDPDQPTASGFIRQEGRLVPINRLNGFVSPRLGIRFELLPDEVRLFTPSGREFQDRTERVRDIEEDLRRTNRAFEEERLRAIEADRRADSYREKLRQMGIDPDQLTS